MLNLSVPGKFCILLYCHLPGFADGGHQMELNQTLSGSLQKIVGAKNFTHLFDFFGNFDRPT